MIANRNMKLKNPVQKTLSTMLTAHLLNQYTSVYFPLYLIGFLSLVSLWSFLALDQTTLYRSGDKNGDATNTDPMARRDGKISDTEGDPKQPLRVFLWRKIAWTGVRPWTLQIEQFMVDILKRSESNVYESDRQLDVAIPTLLQSLYVPFIKYVFVPHSSKIYILP